MADFILRPARERDRAQIIRIWQESFGDSPGFISGLLSCGLFGTAVGAECDGELRSVMFSFDGLSVGGKSAAYLCALCTENDFRGRGLGRAVAEYAAAAAVKRGAQAAFLRPADSGLEKWYADTLGARTVARCAPELFSAIFPGTLRLREISAREYLSLRRGREWQLSVEMLKAQECVHRHFGGAFLTSGSSLLCCENRSGRILVRELISDEPEDALRSAAEYFGAESLDVLRPCSVGDALMLLPRCSPDCEISETEYLPFTFD